MSGTAVASGKALRGVMCISGCELGEIKRPSDDITHLRPVLDADDVDPSPMRPMIHAPMARGLLAADDL